METCMTLKHCNTTFIPLIEKTNLLQPSAFQEALRPCASQSLLHFTAPEHASMRDQILPLPALLQLPVPGMAVRKLPSHLTAEISGVWETRAMWCPKASVQTVGFLSYLCLHYLLHTEQMSVLDQCFLEGEKEFLQKCAFEIKLPLSYEYITYF